MTDRERVLIENLGLKHLNLEAGHFGFVRESTLTVESNGLPLAASNLIYLMLNAAEPINYLQRLESDDCQVLIEGGPADYYLFYPDGGAEKITMGRDLEAGQQFVVAAPGGTAKAIVLAPGADYMLAASVVTPAWTPTQVTIGADESFIERYEGAADWATRDKLIELAGPNFGHISGGATDELDLTIDAAGQIIFLGMQLSLEQSKREIRRFAISHPGKSATLRFTAGRDDAIVGDLKSLATLSGVNFDEVRL
jgi:predicted cupin superfamily sugar epimerase